MNTLYKPFLALSTSSWRYRLYLIIWIAASECSACTHDEYSAEPDDGDSPLPQIFLDCPVIHYAIFIHINVNSKKKIIECYYNLNGNINNLLRISLCGYSVTDTNIKNITKLCFDGIEADHSLRG